MGSVSISGGFGRVGEFHDLEPVLSQRLHDLDERLEQHRLGDERVHAEVVGAVDVLLGLGGREDDDGDGAQGPPKRRSLARRLSSSASLAIIRSSASSSAIRIVIGLAQAFISRNLKYA